MTEKKDDALSFVDTLLALEHPAEDRLWMFTQGKIETGKETQLIERHIDMCSHCMELANMFGWPESNTKH